VYIEFRVHAGCRVQGMGDLQCDCKVLSRAHIEGLRYHVHWIHVFATDKHRLDPMKTSRTYALMILTCPVMAEKY